MTHLRKYLLALFAVALAPLAVVAGPSAPADAAVTTCPSTYEWAYTRYSHYGHIRISVYYLPGSTSRWRYCAVAGFDRAYPSTFINMYARNWDTGDRQYREDDWHRPADTTLNYWIQYDLRSSETSVGPVYWDTHLSGYCLYIEADAAWSNGANADYWYTQPHCNP
jgi:hypothetical protein